MSSQISQRAQISQRPTSHTAPATGDTFRCSPTLDEERGLWRAGFDVVAGVDEVGRGAWAGPVSVGIAVVRRGRRSWPEGLRDSKQLPEAVRESIFAAVASWCERWAVGHASPVECDELGMTAALRLALMRAANGLGPAPLPDAVILDGPYDYLSRVSTAVQQTLDLDAGGDEPRAAGHGDSCADPSWRLDPPWTPNVTTVVKGDARCASVAAASVLAKVTRDRLMRDAARHYPVFDLASNKGYPSPLHQRALRGYGLSPFHRHSWAYVDNLPWVRQSSSRLVRGSAPLAPVGARSRS